jgi:hypothetical protein
MVLANESPGISSDSPEPTINKPKPTVPPSGKPLTLAHHLSTSSSFLRHRRTVNNKRTVSFHSDFMIE